MNINIPDRAIFKALITSPEDDQMIVNIIQSCLNNQISYSISILRNGHRTAPFVLPHRVFGEICAAAPLIEEKIMHMYNETQKTGNEETRPL